jgi:hypothetical protein
MNHPFSRRQLHVLSEQLSMSLVQPSKTASSYKLYATQIRNPFGSISMLSNLKIAGPSETRNAHMVITYLSALPAAGFIFADVGCVDWIE